MRRKLLAATALIGLAIAGCGSDDSPDSATADTGPFEDVADEPSDTDDEEPEAEAAEEPAAGDSGDDSADLGGGAEQTSIESFDTGRHVIYYIDLQVETDNVAQASQQAAALAETAQGFVASESTEGDEWATLTLRVPVDQHASIVSRLEDLGTVQHRSRDAQDVTSEVVDVESRIESQQRSITRIRQLLDDASDLSDVVTIESELARREANLDSLLSRQAELGSLTTLATITVTFHKSGEQVEIDDDDPTFLSGLENGWNAFTATLNYVAVGLGATLPFLGLAAVAGAPFVILRRRRSTQGATLEE